MIDSEVENLIPIEIIEASLNKIFRDVEEEVCLDAYDASKPLVGQIEDFATRHGIKLSEGWKVELAKQFKQRILLKTAKPLERNILNNWKAIFKKLGV